MKLTSLRVYLTFDIFHHQKKRYHDGCESSHEVNILIFLKQIYLFILEIERTEKKNLYSWSERYVTERYVTKHNITTSASAQQS